MWQRTRVSTGQRGSRLLELVVPDENGVRVAANGTARIQKATWLLQIVMQKWKTRQVYCRQCCKDANRDRVTAHSAAQVQAATDYCKQQQADVQGETCVAQTCSMQNALIQRREQPPMQWFEGNIRQDVQKVRVQLSTGFRRMKNSVGKQWGKDE